MMLTYYTTIKEGEMQKSTLYQMMSEVGHFEGKRVEITIKRLKAKRSDAQNRLWWSYIDMVAKEIGYIPGELHDIVKYKFLTREKVDERSGEIFKYIESTTKLNKMEFADLVAEFQRWVSQTFSITLPNPGENWEMIFNSPAG